MQQSWANYGIDLHLELTGSRVRAGLEAALRDAMRTGRLGPGVRLPSSRDLAADLGIARNTVADAYSQLVAEGWLEARTGSGTWSPHGPHQRRSRMPGLPAVQPTPGMTCAPGCPRYRRSRAGPGWPPPGRRSARRTTSRSVTPIRAASLRCGLPWPGTSAALGE